MHFSAFSNTFVFLHNFMGKFLVFPRPLQRLTVHLLYVNLFESSQEMHSSFEKCVPNSIFCTVTFSPAPSSIPAKQLDGNYGVFHAVHTRTVSTQGLFTRAAVSKQRPAPRDTCALRQRISFVETAGRPAPLVDLHTPPFPSGNGGPIQFYIRKRRKAPALSREKMLLPFFLGLPLSLPITFSEPNSHPPLNSSLPR